MIMQDHLFEILLTAIIFTLVSNTGVWIAFYYRTKFQLERHDADIDLIKLDLKSKADYKIVASNKHDTDCRLDRIDSKLDNIYKALINKSSQL